MIARTWRGRTPADKVDSYLAYLRRTGVKDLRSTEGNRGVYVLTRVEDGVAEFFLISLWESIDAIRAFAGTDVERAVYYPEDEHFLLELDPKVTHYEVPVSPDGH